MMRGLLAGARFQVVETRNSPGDMAVVALTPLFTVIFLSIALAAGRDDLIGHALLAPALMALIQQAIQMGGEVIDRDRWAGTLEAVIATPAALATVVLGRILSVTAMSLVALVEVWLVARLVFGITITVPHPGWFVGALAITVAGTAATATVFAALFVLARSARTFQNTLSYPLFLLGGVIVPADLLPAVLQVPARAIYLSWGADLLRAALTPDAVEGGWLHLGMTAALGVASFLVGRFLLGRILTRVRRDGTLTYA